MLLLTLLALAAQAQTPLLRLDLQGTDTQVPAQANIYAQEGATTGFDDEYDAVPPSGNGLTLASLTQEGRRVTINGLPYSAVTASQAVGLFIGVPRYGPYMLRVGQLENFGFAAIYLVDAEQQTRQLLAPGAEYAFSLDANNTGGTYTTSTRFSLVFESATPLPVTLTAFTAQLEGTAGLLHWTTALEHQNAYFQVESSLDGRTFVALGRVAGAGTSAAHHTYQFRDADLARYAAAQVYYRLRQVDADGTSVLSPVRVLLVPAVGLAVAAVPTAGSASQAVRLLVRTAATGPAWLRITDALGHNLGQRALDLPAGTSTVALPEAGQWAPGLYFVQVQQGARRQVARVVRL
jgi:hypothetical protein